jgi:hypothetical protein
MFVKNNPGVYSYTTGEGFWYTIPIVKARSYLVDGMEASLGPYGTGFEVSLCNIGGLYYKTLRICNFTGDRQILY